MQTATLTTERRTDEHLAAYSTDAYSVEQVTGGYVLRFTDADAALAAVEAAKVAAVKGYLRAGGNPRNRRSFGSQFAAVKRAIEVAR